MPFTPFHFGPGALIKSLIPKWFSFRVFLLSQVIMDCETAWNMFRGNGRLHTVFHSYLGSTVVVVLTLVMVLIYNFVYTKVMKHRLATHLFFNPFELRSAIIASIIGAWSHVFLDSIMHGDMMPLKPFLDSNPSLQLISLYSLHLLCVAGFAISLFIYGLRFGMKILMKPRF